MGSTTTTAALPTTSTANPTTTLPENDFDWSAITYRDIVSWQNLPGAILPEARQSLLNCQGGYMGFGTMVQLLVGQVVPLGDITVSVLDGEGPSIEEASQAYQTWSDATKMVRAVAIAIRAVNPDHPVSELIQDLDEPLGTAGGSAEIIASFGFDADMNEADVSTLEVWIPSFLDAAATMNAETAFVEFPGNADVFCP